MTTPVGAEVELYAGSDWIDVTASVKETITIRRGYSPESTSVSPSACDLTLYDPDQDFNPRNPLGPYYGQLGRNTRLRIARKSPGSDDFNRTTANAWGTTSEGFTWTTAGTGGTVSVSNWSVAPGAATHSIPAAAAYRQSYLDLSYRDVEQSVTVDFNISSVTGGALLSGFLMRSQASGDYLIARLSIAPTTQIMSVGVTWDDGTVVAPDTALSGTYSGQVIHLRAQTEGSTVRMSGWVDGDPEPLEWTTVGSDVEDFWLEPGFIGLRTELATGNSNSKPVTATYSNYRVRVPRFIGEISSIPVRWDTSGVDPFVRPDASGILRRLGQGVAPEDSTYKRAMLASSSHLMAYWPCEEPSTATFYSNTVPTGRTMDWTGSPSIASNSDFAGSKALPTLTPDAEFIGVVPAYSGTADITVSFLASVPLAGIAVEQGLCSCYTSGSSISQFTLDLFPDGSLSLLVYDRFGATVLSTGSIALFDLNGQPSRIVIQLERNNPDIAWTIRQETATTTFVDSGTLAGYGTSVTRVTSVIMSLLAGIDTVAFGHVALQREWPGDSLNEALIGYAGEDAVSRMFRLSDDLATFFDITGSQSNYQTLGAEGFSDALKLVTDAAEADGGLLSEARGDVTLAYVPRCQLYNADPAATVDYSLDQIAAGTAPINDDQQSRNDVTVSRTDGSSGRYVVETGPMSIEAPPDGIGRYATALTVNIADDRDAIHQAGWRAHRGTIDEARFPQIRFNMRNPAITGDVDLLASLLSLNVGDRLFIDNTDAAKLYNGIDQLVIGYTETLNDVEHIVTYNCVPASAFQVLRLDTPNMGRLDSGESTLNSGITSSATSVSVATTTDVWTTSAGQMPIQIMVGGEEMTVTAISGATSPQTFTVTRSVNGVVKAHSAGATVSLKRRATLAL